MRRRLLLLPLFVACGGPDQTTLVDELRILAMIPDSPEVEPGQSVHVTPIIVDPQGEGVESVSWLCTIAGPPGTPCGELMGPDPRASLTTFEGSEPFSLVVDHRLSAALPEPESFLDIELRTLTCSPGVCPILADVVGSGPLGEPVVQALSDPFTLLQELPIEGVSYARRPLRVSRRPAELRLLAPLVEASFSPVEPGLDAEVEVEIRVDHPREDELTAFGFATAGGFGPATVEVVEGEAKLTWFAPEEPTEARLWVIVSSEAGEEGVWSAEVGVR
ncbi:MAG: hypothetical protein EA397_12385 [Deltaproteobacteria bacterium]|nr:MAG: hypothetical protein EA397_12385 [Deltaproteobacteria bacterium]